MIKILEDVQVRYDGTVRNTSGSIFQWAYGEDGFDRSSTVIKNDKAIPMDIQRLADRVNLEVEK
jgi:DNA-directed RNA polymerase beta' subunit